MELPAGPIHLVDAGRIDDGSVWLWGTNPYGRLLWAVIPWWSSTAAGIDDALRRSWALLIEADLDRAGALASYAAEAREPYAVANGSNGE